MEDTGEEVKDPPNWWRPWRLAYQKSLEERSGGDCESRQG